MEQLGKVKSAQFVWDIQKTFDNMILSGNSEAKTATICQNFSDELFELS